VKFRVQIPEGHFLRITALFGGRSRIEVTDGQFNTDFW